MTDLQRFMLAWAVILVLFTIVRWAADRLP